MLPRPINLPAEAAEKALAAAEAAGVPRATLRRVAGLGAVGDAIDFAALCALYEQAARLTGDDSFGLHVGERTSPQMYGLLGYVAANAATFGEALARLVDFQRLWSDAAGVEARRRGSAVVLRYWHKGAVPPGQRRHESEQMLAALLGFARWALGECVSPIRVRFEHRAPAALAEHERIFNAPIAFGAPATELVCPERWLGLPVVKADPVLGELMREQAQAALAERRRREPFLDQLLGRTEAAILASGETSLGAAAAALGIGPRTLQRRLRERGLTFRAAAEQARVEQAKALLGQPRLALAEIAHRLGYSQASAFHRAFRRVTGMTPGEYRDSASAE